MGTKAVAVLMLVGGLVGCSADDLGSFGLGDNKNSSDNRGSDRRVAMTAQDACRAEVRERGWTVVRMGDSDMSGVNNVDVSISVTQPDGDTRNMTCTYDAGRKRATLNQ